MILVLDTNCLLQIIPKNAEHRWLFDLIKSEEIQLGITNEILAEYEEVLSDFYSPIVADGVLRILETLESVNHVQVYFKWNLITADPDDNKFSDCAIAVNADYIVSYDRHFSVLKSINFPNISVINLDDLKVLFEKTSE